MQQQFTGAVQIGYRHKEESGGGGCLPTSIKTGKSRVWEREYFLRIDERHRLDMQIRGHFLAKKRAKNSLRQASR
jgi:hypothetical protein